MIRNRVYRAPVWQFILTMAALVMDLAELRNLLPPVEIKNNVWRSELKFFFPVCRNTALSVYRRFKRVSFRIRQLGI